MNEIKRLQQLAGIITEVKVNKPDRLSVLKRGLEHVLEGDKEFTDDEHQVIGINDHIQDINKQEDEEGIREILSDYLFGDEGMIQDYIDMALNKI